MTRRRTRVGASLVCSAALALAPLAAVSATYATATAGAQPASGAVTPAGTPDPATDSATDDPASDSAAEVPGSAEAGAPVALAQSADTRNPTAAPGAPSPEEAENLGLVPTPAPRFARVAIDEVTPQVADGAPGSDAVSGIPRVTVRGTITNGSNSTIRNITVRLQRGEGTTQSSAVRDGLGAPASAFGVGGPPQQIPGTLDPGQSTTFAVSLPLAAIDGPSLQIDTAGVYPLLAAASGTVQGEGDVRLDEARTLLPVMPSALRLLPGGGDAASEGDTAPAGDLTIVYPIAAAPTRRAVLPGLDGPAPSVHLTDSSLLDALADGGRLTGLLDALEASEEKNPQLRDAVCLAIDPELLRTVDDIAAGTEVVVDGPEEARRVPDTAAPAAAWLDRLRGLAGTHCTTALPPAQADLDAVAATGSAALADAVGAGPDLELRRVLGDGVDPLDVTLPTKGTLAPTTLAEQPQLGDRPLLVAASALSTGDGSVPRSGIHALADSSQSVLAFDPSLGAALAATGSVPENPRYSDPEERYWLESDSAAARLQHARASLLAPVLAALTEDGGDEGENEGTMAAATEAGDASAADSSAGSAPGATDPAARSVLVAPPAVWTLDDDGIRSLLDTASAQITAGHLRPVPLGDALARPAVDPAPVRLDSAALGLAVTPDTLGDDSPEAEAYSPPTGPGGSPIPDSDPGAVDIGTVTRVRRAMATTATLHSLVDTSDPTAATADAFLDPLRSEALRALSTTFRRAGGDGTIASVGLDSGDPLAGPDTGRLARDAGVQSAKRLENAANDALEAITLIPPGAVYTMASPNSPLLLVARNGLPFPVQVSLVVDTPPGITVDQPGLISVPAAGSRTMQLPTDSQRSGERSGITIALESPDGTPLSAPVDVEIQTGGSRLAWLFVLGAGLAALLLMVRRYVTVRRANAANTANASDEGSTR